LISTYLISLFYKDAPGMLKEGRCITRGRRRFGLIPEREKRRANPPSSYHSGID
jgi:hypothetical protein